MNYEDKEEFFICEDILDNDVLNDDIYPEEDLSEIEYLESIPF